MRKRSLYRLAFNLHSLGSLAFGLFISIVAVARGIIGFEPEIDRFLQREISYVKPGERFLTLSEIRQAAMLAYPHDPVVAILPAMAKDLAWQVVLPSGIAYGNPYTGQALGMRTRGESFLAKVRAVHVGLTQNLLHCDTTDSYFFHCGPRIERSMEGKLQKRRGRARSSPFVYPQTGRRQSHG